MKAATICLYWQYFSVEQTIAETNVTQADLETANKQQKPKETDVEPSVPVDSADGDGMLSTLHNWLLEYFWDVFQLGYSEVSRLMGNERAWPLEENPETCSLITRPLDKLLNYRR